MRVLILAIARLIEIIEKAPITPKPNPILMMAWGELAETAIETIKKNQEKENIDQLIDCTLRLMEARIKYLKRLENSYKY